MSEVSLPWEIRSRGCSERSSRTASACALSFYGSAHSACKDLDQARAAFAQARKLRSAFSAKDPRFLDESRLPDLEASLRREDA